MTIIAALRCEDGAVLLSDSRETRGRQGQRVARRVQKIYEPRPGFLVAWAGFQNVAQAFALALERADHLTGALDRVEVKRRLEDLVREIRDAGETDYAEWLITWWSQPDGKAVALHLFTARSGEWVTDWVFAGDPPAITIATAVSGAMSFIPARTLSLEQAKLLALKVIRDTIAVGVETIGGDAQLGAVTRQQTNLLSPAQLRGRTAAATRLRPRILLLPAEAGVNSPSDHTPAARPERQPAGSGVSLPL